jgi:hypothetical protein
VKLAKYRNRELVAVLRELLDAAEDGEMQGLTFVAHFGPGDHRAGLAGSYKASPDLALQGIFKMERLLRQDMA